MNNTNNQFSDFTETRTHILLASRELLLAAHGALKFCSEYVEASEKSSPHLKAFFKRAMTVANELSSGLKNMDTIKKAAGSAVKPIFTAIENEMAAEKRTKAAKTRAKRTTTTRKKS